MRGTAQVKHTNLLKAQKKSNVQNPTAVPGARETNLAKQMRRNCKDVEMVEDGQERKKMLDDVRI